MKRNKFWIWVGIIFFGLGFGLLLNWSMFYMVVVVAGLGLWLLSEHISFGLLALVGTGFFINWGIDFSHYSWAREIPYLVTINAPVADFIGLALVGAIIVAGFFNQNWFKEKFRLLIKTPGFWPYFIFLVVALVAVVVANPSTKNEALKFWARPYVFVYVVFVAGFIFGIKKASADFPRFIRVLARLGVAVALFGLASFIFAPQTGVWRAVPFGVWGFAPLGYNHNLLAEVLVSFLPCYLVLMAWRQKSDPAEPVNFYSWGLGLVLSVALLTLSRAAWLASAVTLLVWYFLAAKNLSFDFFKIKAQKFLPAIIVFAVALACYMIYFLGSSTVLSSTVARFDVARMVGFYTTHAPWFGYGPGSFLSVMGDIALLRLEYGDPLDAHGFVQKIILETGVVGLVLFVYFLWTIVRALAQAFFGATSKKEKILFCGLLAMVVGSITFQFFNTSYFNSVFWVPLGLASAALAHKGIIDS